MSHSFFEYRPIAGRFETRRNGVLDRYEEGTATFHALKGAEEPGQFFITPGTKVYIRRRGESQPARPTSNSMLQAKAGQLYNIRFAALKSRPRLQSQVQRRPWSAPWSTCPDEIARGHPRSRSGCASGHERSQPR